MKKPVVLCIMDGFGISEKKEGNAIEAAATPNLSKLFSENPWKNSKNFSVNFVDFFENLRII